jgi:DNA-binding LacI/PurR family transcriptional regulator
MDEAVMQEIAASGLPVVFYDVGVPAQKITNIRVRYEIGMRRMVQYLYVLGHRRMAFLGHHPSLAPLETRKQAFLETVRQYSGQVEFTTVENNDELAGAMQAVRELCSSRFNPTAIVCVNDYMAIGAMRAVRASGLSVPEDVSITGFDNIELSEFTNPPLTTVNIPRGAIGRMAVEALLQEETSSAGQEVSIEPELVLRDSTGPVRR